VLGKTSKAREPVGQGGEDRRSRVGTNVGYSEILTVRPPIKKFVELRFDQKGTCSGGNSRVSRIDSRRGPGGISGESRGEKGPADLGGDSSKFSNRLEKAAQHQNRHYSNHGGAQGQPFYGPSARASQRISTKNTLNEKK